MTIAKITRAYTRHYSDNKTTVAYVEWLDHKGKSGRTESGSVVRCHCCSQTHLGLHMEALFSRARREGITIEQETW